MRQGPTSPDRPSRVASPRRVLRARLNRCGSRRRAVDRCQQYRAAQLGHLQDKPNLDAGDREIALDAGTVAALRAHRRRQIAYRLQWGSAWVDSGKVFTREDGSVLHPATVTDRFQALAAAAKLPPIRLHDLRHGAASLMLTAGVRPKVVQETLGHSTITLTLDTYTSVYSEVAAEAAEAAAALVPRAGTSAHTPHTPDIGGLASTRKALVRRWGGWGSNPRPDGL